MKLRQNPTDPRSSSHWRLHKFTALCILFLPFVTTFWPIYKLHNSSNFINLYQLGLASPLAYSVLVLLGIALVGVFFLQKRSMAWLFAVSTILSIISTVIVNESLTDTSVTAPEPYNSLAIIALATAFGVALVTGLRSIVGDQAFNKLRAKVFGQTRTDSFAAREQREENLIKGMPIVHAKGQTDAIYFMQLPPAKLYLLSVITLGLYDIYWSYRNWKAIQLLGTQKIRPVWRGIIIFYTWPLFKQILFSAKQHGYKTAFSAGWLALTYLFLEFTATVLDNALQSHPAAQFIAGIVMIFLIPLPFIVVQKAINFNNLRLKAVKKPSKKHAGEIIIVIIGILISIFYVTSYFLPDYATITESPEAKAKLSESESLNTKYQQCDVELAKREKTLDTTAQEAVDAYDADWEACDAVRIKQNAAADEYNKLIGQ